jgi:hypothetical protein
MGEEMVRIASSLVLLCLASQAHAEEPRQRVWMDQGWSTPNAQAAEQTWYTISQGSRLIRLDWFYALQDAGAPFAGAAMATDYGYPYGTKPPACRSVLSLTLMTKAPNGWA